jgi:hypothetical protein
VSNTNDYIITTLSSGSKDYTDLSDNQIQAPFSLGVPNARTIRLTGAPYVSTLGNPSSIFPREEISGSPGPTPPSYITPFAYYDFETSGSQYVTNVLGTNNYTGSFTSETNFGFDTDPVFSGSYSFQFPAEYSARSVNLGTIQERANWGTLFSGSFSVSAWMYFSMVEGESYKLNNYRIFGNLDSGATYGFYFGTYRGQPLVYSRDPSTPHAGLTFWGNDDSSNYEGWNHFVFVVDGDTDATNRRFKMFINNTDFGYADDSQPGRYFQKQFLDDENVYFGNNFNGTKQATMNFDEISIWSTALSTGQVNALYNSGNGANALTALTQSS